MALLTCGEAECGKRFSGQLTHCPECGCPAPLTQSADDPIEHVTVEPVSRTDVAEYATAPPSSSAGDPPPAPTTTPPPTASANPSVMGWFYAKDGQTAGPLSEETLIGLARTGVIGPRDLVWSSGATSSFPAAYEPVLADSFVRTLSVASWTSSGVKTQEATMQSPTYASRVDRRETITESKGNWQNSPANIDPERERQSTPPPEGKIPNYFVHAILATLFCCLPIGIVAIMYAAQVNGKKASGDYAGAMAVSKKAKKWINISAGAFLLFVGGSVLLTLLTNASTLSQSRIMANESNAIASLKSIGTGQAIYQKNNWGANNLTRGRGRVARGYCPEIAGLVTDLNDQNQPIQLISDHIAAAATGSIEQRRENAYQGYIFVESKVSPLNNVPGGWQYGHGVFAYPSNYDRTGVNTFWISEEGVVLMMDLGRAATEAASGTEDTRSWEAP